MRELMVFAALTVGSITSFADGFDKAIGKNLVAPCMATFNVTPYIAEAVGGDQPQPVDLDFIKSLRNFRATGHVILSDAQAADPKIVKCATFVEGALAGGGAVQSAFADQKPSPYVLPVQTVDKDQRVQDCQAHFDITGWVKPELVVSLIADKPIMTITPSQKNALESFGKTGELPMTDEQKADPKAMACEVYASGYLVGGVERLFVEVFSSTVVKVVGDAVSKIGSANNK